MVYWNVDIKSASARSEYPKAGTASVMNLREIAESIIISEMSSCIRKYSMLKYERFGAKGIQVSFMNFLTVARNDSCF
jgi:hypothetical protein